MFFLCNSGYGLMNHFSHGLTIQIAGKASLKVFGQLFSTHYLWKLLWYFHLRDLWFVYACQVEVIHSVSFHQIHQVNFSSSSKSQISLHLHPESKLGENDDDDICCRSVSWLYQQIFWNNVFSFCLLVLLEIRRLSDLLIHQSVLIIEIKIFFS